MPDIYSSHIIYQDEEPNMYKLVRNTLVVYDNGEEDEAEKIVAKGTWAHINKLYMETIRSGVM